MAEMKEYIDLDENITVVDTRGRERETTVRHILDINKGAYKTADVRPVVTCERCVYHVDCGYHYCNKWCVNCPDDANFFCAYGEEGN